MGAVLAWAELVELESPLPVESSHLALVSDLERLLQLLSVCESLSQLPSALGAYVSALVYP